MKNILYFILLPFLAFSQDVVNDTIVGLAASASAMKRRARDDADICESSEMALSTMGGLTFLNISGSSVTDKSMEILTTTCSSSLKELDVNFCPFVSNQGLGYLVSRVEDQFTKLRVWGNAQITDEFLDCHDRIESGGLEIIGAWMKQSGKRSLR